jgi:hypothetical protein
LEKFNLLDISVEFLNSSRKFRAFSLAESFVIVYNFFPLDMKEKFLKPFLNTVNQSVEELVRVTPTTADNTKTGTEAHTAPPPSLQSKRKCSIE